MAREVAQESDLILFVVAGDITRTEYQALCQLRRSQKPLILIFNKIDLYPDKDRETIYQQLQQYNAANSGEDLDISTDQIVMVAAKPQPIQVRIEAADGTVTTQWETPPSQIGELKTTILNILNREGRSLLALNALVQARDAEVNIAKKTLEIRQAEAQELIWKYAKYKALIVAVNPIVLLDLFSGMITDLLLIRALARLYGLPITSHEAGNLWRRIMASSAALLLGEIGSSLILGLGKSTAAISNVFESPGSFTAYFTAASIQGAIAGYGAYVVGKVAQVYLEQGCTWGSLGPSTVIAEILSQVERDTIIYRLRQELLNS
jgi:GTPase SAR1 family protein